MADPAAGFTPSPSVTGSAAAAATGNINDNLIKFEHAGMMCRLRLPVYCDACWLVFFSSFNERVNRVCRSCPPAEDHAWRWRMKHDTAAGRGPARGGGGIHDIPKGGVQDESLRVCLSSFALVNTSKK